MAGYWIFSPLQDIVFVLFTPLLIIATFALAQRGAWMDGLLMFALVLAMGHYLPGIMRAYGDRALFRRFQTRLIVAPLFLTALTTWFAYRNVHIVILLAAIWGLWHWMMQAYGFARIYDAKVEATARTPAWLDQMICLLWFGMAVFILNNDLPSFLTTFYESGGPQIPAEAFVWFRRLWLAGTTVVTIVYGIQVANAVREGRRPNPLKFVFIAVTCGYLAYTVSIAQRPKMGLLMFEAWHDVQYLAIVWVFNLSRTRKNPEAGPIIRFLFRPRIALGAAYIATCLAFGSITHAWSLFGNEAVVRMVASLVTSAALLHYYLDGFIWKIRESSTSEALGVRSVGAAYDRPIQFPAWARQALLWPLFVIPAVLFFVIESQGNVRPMRVYENVVEAFPDSPHANYQIARQLQDEGRLREAKAHYERALEKTPDMLPAHVFLGVLLADQRDLAEARKHFEEALKYDRSNAEVHNDLGIVLDEQGDPARARIELERAVALDPKYALAHNNLSTVLAKLGDHEQARVHRDIAAKIETKK